MANNPVNPVDVWAAQLRQEATSDLLAIAVKQRRNITVVLTYDEAGKSKPPKITLG